jgi:cytochrome P450
MDRSNSAATISPEASRESGRIPKGPSAFFFIRHSRALTDPHRIFDVFHEIVECWGPITCSRSGLFERTYIVSDYSAAATIFRSHPSFRKYPHQTADLAKLQALIGKGMLATHTDEEWTNHRQSMAHFFSKGFVAKHFGDIALRHVNGLLGDIVAHDPQIVNVSELAMRLSGRVMSDILAPNHPFVDETFLKIKRLLDESILEFHRGDYKRRARPYKAALREHAALFLKTAADDMQNVGLVQRMMADEPTWQTSPDARERLLDRIINLVVAGYETTATTLNWVTHLLASYPIVQRALREEVKNNLYGDGNLPKAFDEAALLRRTISESMRLYPALWFNIRYVTNQNSINGVRFVKGARVMLLPFIANRGNSVYSEPDAFNPDRYLKGEPGPLFPFGNGQRVCIGRTLAELEMQTFVVGLLKRFQLDPACEPKAIGGVLLQPDRDVKVRFVSL